MLGRTLAERYVLETLIGSGGMADVYKAKDRLLERTVAVKILHEEFERDNEFIERFHREAKAAARIAHSNIVNVYDVGVHEGKHYIVMEYVPGVTLKDKIKTEGKIDLREALRIAHAIASALAEAHNSRLVHCDIKPHNILITPSGVAKVADFGIARAVTESTLTYSESVIGSVHYFSPEQAKGTMITPKSDVYSLGVVLYEMITGKLPFTGDTPVSIAMKHLQEEAAPLNDLLPNLPPVVEALITRSMTKEPAQRPSSLELMRDIEQAMRYLGQGVNTNLGLQHSDPEATQLIPRLEDEEYTEDEDEESGRSYLPSKRVILAIMLMIILTMGFLAGIFISYGKFWSTEEINVPDVKGKTVAVATHLLEEQRLRVTIDEVYDNEVAIGEVVSQMPEAGAVVKEERQITLYVSKGGEQITMPNLRGMMERDARSKLSELGLKVGSGYETFSDEDKGTIISQDPRSGTRITKGQSVDLTVSKGQRIKKVTIPDVKGVAFDKARGILESTTLKIGEITKQESKKPEGTILKQDPEAGSYIDEGTEVKLIVAEPRRKKEDSKSGNSNNDKNSDKTNSAVPDREDNSKRRIGNGG